MTVRVRFAPSPTGNLHLGNFRVAMINWAFAQKMGGEFILRIDDTDLARSKDEYTVQIKKDMAWGGIMYHASFHQSHHFSLYDDMCQKPKEAGRLYPCFERETELNLKRKAALQSGKPPIYDRAALKLSQDEIAERIASGHKPHWRFKLDDEDPIAWVDLVRGPTHYDPKNLSDPVVIKEDGAYLYTLTSIIDDGVKNISHVIRGEDHVTNTAIQIQMFKALGFSAPHFAHLPLMTDKEGKGLSKRLGALSIMDMAAQGYEPQAVQAYLLRMGTSNLSNRNCAWAALIEEFDLEAYGRSSPKMDLDELGALNAHIVHQKPFAEVQDQVEVSEDLWNLCRENISFVPEIAQWQERLEGRALIPSSNKALLKQAQTCLPTTITAATWKSWTTELAQLSGLKGKDLFMPLRQALMGTDHGPDMSAWLALLGHERAQQRLAGTLALS